MSHHQSLALATRKRKRKQIAKTLNNLLQYRGGRDLFRMSGLSCGVHRKVQKDLRFFSNKAVTAFSDCFGNNAENGTIAVSPRSSFGRRGNIA